MKIIISCIIFIMLSASVYAESECDYSVEILLDSNKFEPDEFRFKIRALRVEGPSTNLTARILIASNGSTIKNYKPWTNSPISKQKTSNEYSPNLREGAYEIKAEISTLCNDFSRENNIDERNVLIKSSLNNSQEIMTAEKTEDALQNPDKVLNSYNPNETQNEIIDNKTNLKEKITNIQPENMKANKIIYESSNEKAKGLIVILLLTISIILNIILIWKR